MTPEELDELERRLTQWERDTDAASYPIDCDELLALITAARRPEPDREAVAKLIEDGICLIDACGQVCVDGDSIKRIASNILALFALSPAQAERARDPRFIAAKDLTDDELSAEHARISAQCDEFEAGARNGEEMGGGSPGEMMYERFGEIANERGRRASLRETDHG